MQTTIADILISHCERLSPTAMVRCRICGREGDGITERPSSFVVAYQLRDGDGFCVECGSVWKWKPFRNKSWIATAREITWINAGTDGMDRVRRAIEYREEPMVIQLSFSGQKHSWLAWPWAITTPDLNGIFVYTDICDKPVFLSRDVSYAMQQDVDRLIELGAPKTESQNAAFSAKTYKRLAEHMDILERIEERYHGRIDWQLATSIFWRRDHADGDDCNASRLEKTRVAKSD